MAPKMIDLFTFFTLQKFYLPTFTTLQRDKFGLCDDVFSVVKKKEIEIFTKDNALEGSFTIKTTNKTTNNLWEQWLIFRGSLSGDNNIFSHIDKSVGYGYLP